MVLLESLTGKAAQPALGAAATGSRRQVLRAAASELAAARSRVPAPSSEPPRPPAAASSVRGCELSSSRALDPSPGQRYTRAWELAEDLDRWRTERPLAFTAEPFWGLTVPRRLRRGRRVLITVALHWRSPP